MEICSISQIAKKIEEDGLTIEQLKELFEEKNLTNSLKFDSNLEYIKRKIMLQFGLEQISMVNGKSQYDTIIKDGGQAYKETNEIIDRIFNKVNNTDVMLKFDSQALQMLFGNDLDINSQEDVETFQNMLYRKNEDKNQILVDDICYEEMFKQDYEKTKNPVYKVMNFFKYKKLTNKKEIESKQLQTIRNYIRKRIRENDKKVNMGIIIAEVRAYINKGREQYNSNQELLGIAKGVISSLSQYGDKINIIDVSTKIRKEMNKVQPDQIDIGYRTEEVKMGDERFHEEVFVPINHEKINGKMEELQKKYEQLFDNTNISNEEYLKGVAEIYADIIYTQPYSDGNKRTAMGILNAMILAKNIIPPYITTLQETDFSENISKAKKNEYELLGKALVDSYRNMNKTDNLNLSQEDGLKNKETNKEENRTI